MPASDDETDALIANYTKENIVTTSAGDKNNFGAVALFTSLIPLYLFFGVFGFDLFSANSLPIAAVVVGGSTATLAYSYINVAARLRTKLYNFREEAITIRSVSVEASSRGEKPQSLVRKKKDQLVKNVTSEANAYAVYYNNSIFLISVIVLSRFILIAAPIPVNYILSVALSAALVTILSAPQK